MRVAAAVVLATVALVPWLAARPPAEDAGVLERFEVLGDGDGLLVPVTIRGKTYRFLVDTGASTTMYDLSLRGLLGQPRGKETIAGAAVDVAVQQFEAPEAFVGKLPLPREEPVYAPDLGRLRQVSGHPIQGVVGMDFLRRYVVRIDFDAGVLTLQRRAGADPGEAIPLHTDANFRNAFFVEGDVVGSGPAESFLVDTGFCGSGAGALQADLYDSLVALGKMENAGGCLAATVGHEGKVQQGRVQRFTVGSFEHRGLVFSSARDSRLDLGFWSRYTVTFDFPNRTAYLRKGQRWGHTDGIDRSGLHIHRPAGETVAVVDADSPAARAGIQTGDVVLTLKGADALRARLHPLRQLLREGKTVQVRLRRGGRSFEVAVQVEGQQR
jgi:hypothetical protein